MKKLLLLFLLVSLLGGSGFWYMRNGHPEAAFLTAAAERGDIVATINATGTIEPEEVVNVGAQVAGQIKRFGVDPNDKGRRIDYGSLVEEGTVLAVIDDAIYQAQVNRATADLARANADLIQLQDKEAQAERDWMRLKSLRPGNLISDAEYEAAGTGHKLAQSARAVGKAAVDQAKAALDQVQINLSYCTIKSPVKGVIVDRRVNVGQTVVASLNSPSLFLIAKDLKRLQVWASVNEADVGHIKSGQEATFTVDAFPRRVFRGVVAADQPRLNASMTQNVVTYTVVVNTDNADGKLLPYMTANLQFTVDRREKVLLVPNAALRFRPDPDDVAEEYRAEFIASQRRSGGPSGDNSSSAGRQGHHEQGQHEQGIVWVLDADFVRPIRVELGASDGSRTEIVSDNLKEGDSVVMGAAQRTEEAPTKNPFQPQLRGRKRQ